VGLESEPVKHESEQYMLLRRHYEKIDSISLLSAMSCKRCFIPENNLGLEASHLDTMVRSFTNVRTFWEKETRPGVCKTAQNTREYQFLMNNALYNQTIRFARNLFTTSRTGRNSSYTPETIKALLEEQTLRYHWEKKPAADAFGKEKVTVTGKLHDKQDDLLIAVMMVLYWGRCIMKDPRKLARL
jgi:hypothetical protein